MSRYPPVCSSCKREYRCALNEVVVVRHGAGVPMQMVDADEWECPGCGHRIIIGFAPVTTHRIVNIDAFDQRLARIPANLRRDEYPTGAPA